jgi:predicted amidohydrolase
MKIGGVQLRSFGDVAGNTTKHLKFIDCAVSNRADLVFIPELSLTGYEPRLANALATDEADACLDVFQQRSDADRIIVGLGLPLWVESHVQIGMVWFTPNRPRRSYAKQQLHSDELPFFVCGNKSLILEAGDDKLAPAICYESLQPNHAESVASLGADIYLVSVAKPEGPFRKAMLHYPAIARKHAMHVIMANCVGLSDDFVSVGQSAVWNARGELLAQMEREAEGTVMFDTISGNACMCRAD